MCRSEHYHRILSGGNLNTVTMNQNLTMLSTQMNVTVLPIKSTTWLLLLIMFN